MSQQLEHLTGLDQYLHERDNNPDFLMIEFGHGDTPVHTLQPTFTGQRAYIGVESWMRDPDGKKRQYIDQILRTREDQNVFFMESYQSELLPDDIADEVVLSNVFGDPKVAHDADASVEILHTVSRLLHDTGRLVVRETLTPHLAGRGLELAPSYGFRGPVWECGKNSRRWNMLEDRFGSQQSLCGTNAGSFYAILSK